MDKVVWAQRGANGVSKKLKLHKHLLFSDKKAYVTFFWQKSLCDIVFLTKKLMLQTTLWFIITFLTKKLKLHWENPDCSKIVNSQIDLVKLKLSHVLLPFGELPKLSVKTRIAHQTGCLCIFASFQVLLVSGCSRL